MQSQKKYGINDFQFKIASLRDEMKMSQKEFADFLGIATGAVGGYENGSRMPNAKQIITICEKCNVSADYLLRADTNVKPPDTTVQAICEYTGLSEKAVEFLHAAKNDEGKTPYSVLNLMLESAGQDCSEGSDYIEGMDFLDFIQQYIDIDLPNDKYFSVGKNGELSNVEIENDEPKTNADYSNGIYNLESVISNTISEYTALQGKIKPL